jgi:hypothetical protein
MQRCEYTQLAEYVSSTAVKQTSMERSHSWASLLFLDLISAACAQTIANSDSQFSLSEDQGSSRARPDSFALSCVEKPLPLFLLLAGSLFVPLARRQAQQTFRFSDHPPRSFLYFSYSRIARLHDFLLVS